MQIGFRESAVFNACLLLFLLATPTTEDATAVDSTSETTDAQKNGSTEGLNVTEERIVSVVTDTGIDENGGGGDDVPVKETPFVQPFAEIVSQNSGIANELDVSQGVVHTLVESELKDRAKLSGGSSSPEEIIFNDTADETGRIDNVTIEREGIEGSTITTATTTDLPPVIEQIIVEEIVGVVDVNATEEEIPSFSEWTQKQLEEAEKKREEVNTSVQGLNWNGKVPNNLKLRSKNYASPDCGAKIALANPEAGSPGNVLNPSRDEYLLNTCTSRIWFIVELCEAIQAKKIDLANFELFSSSPKDLSVYVSDRFPTRDWLNVGQFTANDERDVQSFDLHPHLFGRYIKVEMHSHHGSEHFCPISLFRVYGTSEFEVLEKENQQHPNEDDDDDDTLEENGQTTKNLFISATDAVISIVKKAAEALGNNKGNVSNQTDETKITKYSPLMNTCSTPSYIVVCDNCSDVLFGNVYELLSCKFRLLNHLLNIDVLKRTVYNTAICLKYGLDFRKKRTEQIPYIYTNFVESFFQEDYIAGMCNGVAIIENKLVLNVSKQINTTKEIEEEIITEEHDEIQVVNETKEVNEIENKIMPENETKPMVEVEEVKQVIEIEEIGSAEMGEIDENENFFNTEMDFNENTTQSATPSPHPIKESVFLRLSNRIKSLERNMSLSSQYLEELSRRYKKQVEEMQRLLDKTINALSEERKRDDRLEEKLNQLTEIVEAMIAEKNTSFNGFPLFLLIVFCTIIIFTFCRRNEFHNRTPPVEIQRRKSIDVINHKPKVKKQRRPSEEALKITGTYEHLLLDDLKKKSKDRKRRKKKLSTVTLTEEIESKIDDIRDMPFALEESDNNPLQDLPLPKPLQSESVTEVKESPPVYLKTALETRQRRKTSPNSKLSANPNLSLNTSPNGFIKQQHHRKSASVDETSRQKSPAPSANLSLDITFKEYLYPTIPNTGIKTETQPLVVKKEKKGALRKIFKKVF